MTLYHKPTPDLPFTVGLQETATINNSLLPISTYGYDQNEDFGYIVGGRLNGTAVRKIFKIDLKTNEVTEDAVIPTEGLNATLETASATLVNDILYVFTEWEYFSYNTVTKEFVIGQRHTDSRYVTISGQCSGSYNGKIYRANTGTAGNFNIIEYDTVTDTHSIFATDNTSELSLYPGSIIVGEVMYIWAAKLSNRLCMVNLITKSITYRSLLTPSGTLCRIIKANDRLYFFDSSLRVQSMLLAEPFTVKTEKPLLNTTYNMQDTAVFHYGVKAKSFTGVKANMLGYKSYEVGP